MSAEEKPKGFNNFVLASDLEIGKLYEGVIQWTSGGDTNSGWWYAELVRIEDGVYRRFINSFEDSHKLYKTYDQQSLATTLISLKEEVCTNSPHF